MCFTLIARMSTINILVCKTSRILCMQRGEKHTIAKCIFIVRYILASFRNLRMRVQRVCFLACLGRRKWRETDGWCSQFLHNSERAANKTEKRGLVPFLGFAPTPVQLPRACARRRPPPIAGCRRRQARGRLAGRSRFRRVLCGSRCTRDAALLAVLAVARVTMS